jgi:glycosyltransferase involved in cell wall biosynthesis
VQMAAMDAALCASLSESCGYAAAEAVELGIPAVATRAVRSLDAGELIVDDPTSVDDVAHALDRALANKAAVAAQRESLHRRSAANEAIACDASACLAA